jgi:hypothetical protein
MALLAPSMFEVEDDLRDPENRRRGDARGWQVLGRNGEPDLHERIAAVGSCRKVTLEHARDMQSFQNSFYPTWTVQVHYYLALAYESVGRNADAIEEYEEFLRLWGEGDIFETNRRCPSSTG